MIGWCWLVRTVSVVLDIVVIHLPRAAVVPNEVTLGAAQVDSAQLKNQRFQH